MFHYTYILKFKPSQQLYYGVRTSKSPPNEDLFKKYFSSSNVIKNLIIINGIDSFEFEVRAIFKSRKKALRCEEKCLRKMNVLKNDMWINKAINSNFSFSKSSRFKGKRHSQETKEKISIMSKKLVHTKETKEKIKAKMIEQRRGNDFWISHLRKISKNRVVSEEYKEYLKNSEKYIELRKRLTERVTCPHCQKEGSANIMKRWHFEKCKFI